MAADRLEGKLAKLRAVSAADAATRIPALRSALHDRSNVVIARAAEIAGRAGDDELISELLAVYDGLFGDDAVARDPLVRAKEAIARALRALGHREPAPFVRGLHHVQLEPVWGGLEDAAAGLRCACAHALVDTDLCSVDALRELIPHLVDPLAIVRADTVTAIRQVGGDEAALLLRLKAYAGDEEPEVVGRCFNAILELEPGVAVAVVGPFLSHADDAVQTEAAAALALSRDPAALERLRAFIAASTSVPARAAAVTALAASPQPAVVDLLLTFVSGADPALAKIAVRALAESRFRDGARARVSDAVRATRDRRLDDVYAEAFGDAAGL